MVYSLSLSKIHENLSLGRNDYNTYQIKLHLENSNDQLIAIYVEREQDNSTFTQISTTHGTFYRHALASSNFFDVFDYNTAYVSFFPEMIYSSGIGIPNQDSSSNLEIFLSEDVSGSNTFSDQLTTSKSGGAAYITPDISNIYCDSPTNKEIIIGQFTTYGYPFGRLNFFIFPEGNQDNAIRRALTYSWADMSGADLSGTDLRSGDFSGVDFTNADLSGADLTNTDLSGADLTGATLTNTNLILAKNIQHAIFTNATGPSIKHIDMDSTSFTLSSIL